MNPRIILITGANGTLGLALARAFLDESPANFVWLGVNRRREKADALAAANATRCQVVLLDVTAPTAWAQAVAQILAAHQRLDVLVNNAGTHDDAFLATMKLETWRDVLAVNLDGVFNGCQAVLPTMITQRSGRIINISSLSALLAPVELDRFLTSLDDEPVVALLSSFSTVVEESHLCLSLPNLVSTYSFRSRPPGKNEI